MIYFDEHNRLHIVDNDGWWTPGMIPALQKELYNAIQHAAEEGLPLMEIPTLLHLLVPTKEQMINMFAPRSTANKTGKEGAQ